MRLINADALKTKVEAMITHKVNESDYEFGRNQALDYVADILIEDEPTIDAVEVVRCKDCKHKYVSGNNTTQYYVCDFMDAQYEEDGFCHHGESEVEE